MNNLIRLLLLITSVGTTFGCSMVEEGSTRGTGAEIGFGSDTDYVPDIDTPVFSSYGPVTQLQEDFVVVGGIEYRFPDEETEKFIDNVKPGMTLAITGQRELTSNISEFGFATLSTQAIGVVTDIETTSPFTTVYTVNGLDYIAYQDTIISANITLGDRVKIYGMGDISSQFYITRLEAVDEESVNNHISGFINEINVEQETISIGQRIIDFSDADISEWDITERVSGALVSIESADFSTNKASHVISLKPRWGSTSNFLYISGLLSDLDIGNLSAKISGSDVNISSNNDTFISDLVSGNILYTETEIDTQDTLTLTAVARSFSPMSIIVEAPLAQAWNESDGSISLSSQTFTAGLITLLPLSISDNDGIATGTYVKVAAYQNGSNLIATSISESQRSSGIEIRARLERSETDQPTLLGNMIVTTSDAQIFNSNGQQLSDISLINDDQWVIVEAEQTGDSVLSATVIREID